MTYAQGARREECPADDMTHTLNSAACAWLDAVADAAPDLTEEQVRYLQPLLSKPLDPATQAYVDALVESAPPITPDQEARLHALFGPALDRALASQPRKARRPA